MNELTGRDFTEAAEPFELFASWFAEAQKSEPNDPDAMALATTDANGLPDVRMVLLKEALQRGGRNRGRRVVVRGGIRV